MCPVRMLISWRAVDSGGSSDIPLQQSLWYESLYADGILLEMHSGRSPETFFGDCRLHSLNNKARRSIDKAAGTGAWVV